MKEITISKKHLFLWLLVIILVAAIGFGVYTFRRFLPGQETVQQAVPTASSTTPNADQPAQAAAVSGAQAFYTMDYQKGKQAWLDQLCAVSTNTGCVMDQNVFVPAIWPQLAATKTVTTVQVSVQAKVLEQVDPLGNVPQQVWRLGIQLSAPWSIQKQPLTNFPALALVARENGAWKFERFLTEDEANALGKKVGQP